IFGDHSDVMSARSTGFGMLSSNSVQEVMDMALIAQAATLEARLPFMHFFDGFRTSHEVAKVEQLSADDIRAMIDENLVFAHRSRALTPDRPVIRGTAQNPDVYFQAREACNPYYLAAPTIVQNAMDKFASISGRQYHLFDYVGAPDAERVIIIMGSGAEVAHETVEALLAKGEKIGLLKVRLFRPFAVETFVKALPESVKSIAVLDRTKEPGATGEPLYCDVITALCEMGVSKKVIGGRYGLSSKEFTPAMVKGVYDELKKSSPKNHFTIGIKDDVTHTSLDYDPDFSTEPAGTVRALFYGLGADGTVGANKNSIKIIGEETDNFAQGYFVYDSKKSGSITTSHLRFGNKPIRSSYLITKANFVACHQFSFLERIDMLKLAEPGATFLLNSPFGKDEVWDHLPKLVQRQVIEKKLKFYVINGDQVAKDTGMGGRINTIMQTCFFAISGVLPREEAIAAIKYAINKTYGKRGESVVKKNYAAVDAALSHLHEVTVPDKVTSLFDIRPPVPAAAPKFVQDVLAQIIAGNGDDLPVSAMPIDGTFPSGTAQWEKRNIALEIPEWDQELCIQCGKCVLVCPHGVIRAKVYDDSYLGNAPATFKAVPARWKDMKERMYTLQVAPEDCTGCTLCVQVCPAKSKSEVKHRAINMVAQPPLRETEAANWDFFLTIPETDRKLLSPGQVKDIQLLRPLFEFSGACSGCGETPYLKLLTQLFGDRVMIGNATGCSSIYGANLPTTPYCTNEEGRGPSWSNSLFEDNAEFGLGQRLAVDKQNEYARELVWRLGVPIGEELAQAIINADQKTEQGVFAQRERVAILKQKLSGLDMSEARDLLSVADSLVKKSVWIIGGDGWAYDIGYGGLDHVLASGRNVNVLVLDTEVYSNTGGQASKSTPRGAVAKFAAGGKPAGKKDLALMAISYGSVYVAKVAMGSSDMHTVKAFNEAEAFDGPSLIIAYSHCIAHGYDLSFGLEQQKAAVNSGYWPLFRYNPDLAAQNKNPFQMDSRAATIALKDYIYNETRYTMLAKSNPEQAQKLYKLAQEDVAAKWTLYEHMSKQAGNAVEEVQK
ncbi:MAG: pyruvate flavodoxin/ferredoxin oxidoreductase domain protein, partial [Candidatus Solibacter sp.]|nr:pyruvate flavodoxin/ferredoxin oxidoreductase domain protein [Candidatus Solibacter sp.]